MPQTTTELQISVEETAAWSRRLVITVPANRVETERARVASQLSKRVRIPGFRKGKVPQPRVEARFGPEIDRQTQQRLIEKAFREAIQEKSLDPISEPRIAKVNFDRGSEFTFEVAFDIRPEIKVARTSGFRLTRPQVSVADEEVEARLKAIQRQQAIWRPVQRRPLAGDTVEVTITPLDEPDAERQPYRFALGEGRAIPEVEAAIMTLEPGTTEEFAVTFPDDFDDEEQRGATRQMRIELAQVLEQELPELDDEFARSVGDFADLEALRSAVAEDLHNLKEQEVELQIDQRLIEQLIEANPFEVPESMVDRYVDALVGEPPEGADPELVSKARDEARPAAEWGIKRTLILQRVAESEELEATPGEIGERVAEIARRAGKSASEVRGRLAKTGELRDLERRMTEENVLRFLRERSEIKS